ncbi:MAG: type I glyceraldehyde-3-phosphate dehydrogenase [Patescibacteria group bacterium]
MNKIRLAINGAGRTGRAAFKIARQNKNIEVVAINNTSGVKMLANLLKYDTIFGRYQEAISYNEADKTLMVGQDVIANPGEKEPEKLPWSDLKVDVVLECSGKFIADGKAVAHIKAGAKQVILSAPSKGENEAPAYVIGVNDDQYKGDQIISNASCTTNCVAPVMKIMGEVFGVKKGFMTTVHSYTSDQNLHDNSHKKDMRRARAAALNIIPASTGAAKTTAKTLPELTGKFDGSSFRVPTPTVSISDFNMLVARTTTIEEVNQAFISAAQEEKWQNILAVTEDPVVSSDFIGDPHSSTVDLSLTKVVDGDFVHLVSWYDNEWGYATRLVELAVKVGKKVK